MLLASPYFNDKQAAQAEKLFKKAAADDAVLEAPELKDISAINKKVNYSQSINIHDTKGACILTGNTFVCSSLSRRRDSRQTNEEKRNCCTKCIKQP